ncbi:large conductance mechanosensitive channel protein MscL [Fictibacillus nanhaiensis]|uniref:large conductance mechanosensitive channel protein MscL n=1 Tax=Fictibacillus nanhaiensis TaxID=742169 RepID=UPI001C93B53A|nr:large conductance mechanosensitive channel protein MscL [Fictibacillus nanhaiensis]MBY6037777.1 large conductance mechanosensitive channel protein MscL [Fictibacillus nanhaiensis]
MFKEFKTFIMRGNVMDLAIGVIIGAAFGKIVTSLVEDMIMPPIGLLLGKVDFSNLYINLGEKEYSSLAEAQKAGAATLNYGNFINTLINFFIIALVIFIVVKQLNRMKKKEEVKAPDTKECQYCLSTIPLRAVKCQSCTANLNEEGTLKQSSE